MWVTCVFLRMKAHSRGYNIIQRASCFLVKWPVSVWVSVHHSIIRKRLGKNGLHGRVPRCKNKINAEQKEHKGLSQICQKTSWRSSWLLGKYSVDRQDKSRNFWKVCVCPITSLNRIQMLWHDLQIGGPCLCGSVIPPQCCKRLIASYGKCLIAIVAAKGSPASYKV